jgi:hypothetical protein
VLLDTPELQAKLPGGLSRFCPKGSWAGGHFGLSYGPVRGRQSGISRAPWIGASTRCGRTLRPRASTKFREMAEPLGLELRRFLIEGRNNDISRLEGRVHGAPENPQESGQIARKWHI